MRRSRATLVAPPRLRRRTARAQVVVATVLFGALALYGCGSGAKVTVTRTVGAVATRATSPTTRTTSPASPQPATSPTTTADGSPLACAAQVGEGHSFVEFTARGIGCPAGAKLIGSVLNALYSRCHLSDGQPMIRPCQVQGFTCTVGANTGVPSSPGSPVLCATDTEVVRFVLPG